MAVWDKDNVAVEELQPGDSQYEEAVLMLRFSDHTSPVSVPKQEVVIGGCDPYNTSPVKPVRRDVWAKNFGR